MPTQAKRTENMNQHLTDAEKAARQQAEAEVMPDRPEGANLKKPRLMGKDAAAARYWRVVLSRMDGLDILDDLDSEMLATYCVMLSRYERLSGKVRELDDVEKLSAMEGKLQALERNLLQYAEKLGLTPSGRARLAAKRAENAGEEDPDADLFG